jgi:uncharacterized membrane protein YhaH (DUF805 family)
MLSVLWLDLFKGWKTGRLARLKSFAYQLVIIATQLSVAFFSLYLVKGIESGSVSALLSLLSLLLVIIILSFTIYCCILIITKRMRDLGFKYPIACAVTSYAVNIFLFKTPDIIINQPANFDIVYILFCAIYVILFIFNLYLLLGKSKV